MRLCAVDEGLILLKYSGRRGATVASTGAAMLSVKSAHTTTGSQFVNENEHWTIFEIRSLATRSGKILICDGSQIFLYINSR